MTKGRGRAAAAARRTGGASFLAAALLSFSCPAAAICGPGSTPPDARTALIVIDLQRGILDRPTLLPVDELVGNARQLLGMFRPRDIPVVLVRSSRQPPGRTEQPHSARAADPRRSELLPALDRQPADHVVEKLGWSAFTGTDLGGFLTRHRVTQVVILGFSTSIAVESTARDAYDMGYNVTIISDGITDTDAGAHDRAVLKLFPRLGEVVTTADFKRCLASGR